MRIERETEGNEIGVGRSGRWWWGRGKDVAGNRQKREKKSKPKPKNKTKTFEK